MEAELLSGVRIEGGGDAERAARSLLETGLGRVFITLGPDGALAAEDTRVCRRPRFRHGLQTLPAQATPLPPPWFGAGCTAWGWKKAAWRETPAAAIAAQSEETVNPALCEEALRQKMMEVQA